VRLVRLRISLQMLLAFVALACVLLGAERLWQRSEHYRKQAALCAFFELKSRGYAAQMAEVPYMTIEDRNDSVQGNLIEAKRYAALKNVYYRIARRPWESLPADTPDAVNPWDLWSLSTSDIEAMVAEGLDDGPPEASKD
jgi:hypothetical protein